MAFYFSLILSLLILFLDQVSKFYVSFVLFRQKPPPIHISSFLQLVDVWNRGISFGFLSWLPGWLIVCAISAVILSLVLLFCRAKNIVLQLAYGSIVGGATGNLLDRLRFGAVFDFISLHLDWLYLPAFNLADMAITVGFLMLFVDLVCQKKS